MGTINAPADLVRAQLERILASPGFGQAESLSRLLRYLVLEALAGHTDRLKEYTLGVEVFQRGADFDPRIDTIVRTQVRRLRAKLDSYYAELGRQDAIVIDLPKGTYIPVVVHRPAQKWLPNLRVPAAKAMSIAAGACVLLLIAAIAIQQSVGNEDGRVSVAVLPFADFSPGGQPGLAGGVTEEISQALARIPALRVASRTSVLQYKDRGEDIRKIGAELGVTAVVEGSIRRQDDRVRITAHLVSARDGYRLWSRTWETSPVGVERAPLEAAQGIADALRVAPALGGGTRPHPEAYRLYLKGRLGPGNPRSYAYLNQAVRIDPRFAAAWMAKAEGHLSQHSMAFAPAASVLPDARDAARRAIELGYDIASAHLMLGTVAATYDWDWDRAEREYLRALEMDPHLGWARLRYAQLLVLRGRASEAIEQVQRIGAIDPSAAPLAWGPAAIYYLARQYDRAIDHCKAVVEASPGIRDCHYWIGRAYLSKGMAAEAAASIEKFLPATGQGFGSAVSAYLAAGRRAEALRLRAEVERYAAGANVSPVSLAQLHFAFGESEAGFRQLQRAVELKDQSLPSLNVEPVYDPIRSDPRFQKILRKVRL